MIEEIKIGTTQQGLLEITHAVMDIVSKACCDQGLCTLFVKHTSASLTIQENADPSAKRDLETWLNRLVLEDDPLFTHTHEGPDDMPSHIKSALTATSLSIPIYRGELTLGTWQGIYLWEHRTSPHTRIIVAHIV